MKRMKGESYAVLSSISACNKSETSINLRDTVRYAKYYILYFGSNTT